MHVRLVRIRVNAHIGVDDLEQSRVQPLFVTVSIDYDGTQAAQTDDIADAVDYQAVKACVVEVVQQRRFRLIECLATEIKTAIMAHPNIESVTVEVHKPGAFRGVEDVVVTV